MPLLEFQNLKNSVTKWSKIEIGTFIEIPTFNNEMKVISHEQLTFRCLNINRYKKSRYQKNVEGYSTVQIDLSFNFLEVPLACFSSSRIELNRSCGSKLV